MSSEVGVEYWIEFRMKHTKMYVCTLVEFILVDIWISGYIAAQS